MQPKEITVSETGDALLICWSDDSLSRIPGDRLRRACDCSACRSGNRGGGMSLSLLNPAAHQIRKIDLLSSSWLLVIWGDGHDRSIYTFTSLREQFPPEH